MGKPSSEIRRTAPSDVRWYHHHPKTYAEWLHLESVSAWPLRQLEVYRAGIDHLTKRYLAGSECSTTHLLYWVHEGTVTCDQGAGPKPLRAGEIAICPALTPHWVSLDQGDARAIWMHLHDVERWKFLHTVGPLIRRSRESEAIEFVMNRCISEGNSLDFGAYENAVHYAEILGVMLMRELSAIEGHRDVLVRQKLEQLRREVDANLQVKWNVALLAKKIHVSPRHLHELCLKHFGATPLEFVTGLRMDRAMELLLHSDSILETVAAEVGYQSAYAFSDAFLRRMGKRPGEVRRAGKATG